MKPFSLINKDCMKCFSKFTHCIVKPRVSLGKMKKSEIWNLPKLQLGQVELYLRDRIRKNLLHGFCISK